MIYKLFKSKKAISPLIATVLLIAFAVALGAVVMSWGRGYVEDTTNLAESSSGATMSCSMNTGIKFVKNEDRKNWVCNSTSTNITFVIENTGMTTFEGLKLVAVGNTSINQTLINDSIEPGDYYMGSVDLGVSDVSRFTIMPKIVYEGEYRICSAPTADAYEEDIYDC